MQRLVAAIMIHPRSSSRCPAHFFHQSHRTACVLTVAISANLVWFAPVAIVLLALEYHAIVRWEEGLLAERIGDPYAEYVARVPRWVPSLTSRPKRTTAAAAAFSWRDTLFSERGTLIAIGVGFLLLWLKARF